MRQLCGRRQLWGEGLIVKGDDQVEQPLLRRDLSSCVTRPRSGDPKGKAKWTRGILTRLVEGATIGRSRQLNCNAPGQTDYGSLGAGGRTPWDGPVGGWWR